MTNLIKYEAACRAIAECKAVDEVKTWADKAAAMQAYGRMAKDKTLEIDASEIRLRAERRLGQMLAEQKATGGLSKGAAGAGVNQHTPREVPSSVTRAPTLAGAGISYDLSSRAQKLAAVPEAEFEAELAAKRERDQQEGARVSARLEAAGERALQNKPAPEPAYPPPDEDLKEMLLDMQRECESYARRLADWERVMQSDGKQALVTAIKRYEHAEREKALADERAAQAMKQRDRYLRDLKACGKAVGETDIDKVARAVQGFARKQTEEVGHAD